MNDLIKLKKFCIICVLLIISGCSKENTSNKLTITNNETSNTEVISNDNSNSENTKSNSCEITQSAIKEDNVINPTLLLKINNNYELEDCVKVDDIEGDGPTGFYISDKGMIYICDSLNYGIIIFDEKGKFYKRIKLEEQYKLMDIYVEDNSSTIYVLTFNCILKINFSGEIVEKIQIPNIKTDQGDTIYPQSINKIENDIILYYSYGKIYSLNKKEMIDTLTTKYTFGIDNKKAFIEDSLSENRVYLECAGEPEIIKILSINTDGLIYLHLYIREINNNTPENFYNEVIILDNKKTINRYICLQYDSFYHQGNKLKVINNQIYQMVIDSDGLCIYNLN